jgi:GPH family glycoside/pentoside/hexuronide:cation symporter
MTKPPLPAWKPALWGTGQIAVQVYRDIPSLLLLFYMTQVLSISPALAGAAIFIPKLLWSTTCDYIVGTWSDRLRAGIPRRFLLLAGAALAPVALIALFLPPTNPNQLGRALHISFWLLLYVSVFSLFSVPHLSIGAELTANAKEQSRIMAWRTAFIGVGAMIGAGFAPWLIQVYGHANGYHIMSIVMSCACSLALIAAFFGSQEADTPDDRALPPDHRWRRLAANAPFLYTLLAFLAQMIGQGAAYATLAYLVVFKLAIADPFKALSFSVLLSCLAVITIQPIAVRLTNRFGSRHAFMVGSFFYASSLAWMALGPTGSRLWFFAGALGLGLTNSITLQSIYTRLSELVSLDASTIGGRSQAGFLSSLFVAGEKIAFALGGTLLAGTILSVFGFVPGAPVQSARAVDGIVIIFAGTPIVFNVIAIMLMFRSKPVVAAEVVQIDGLARQG